LIEKLKPIRYQIYLIKNGETSASER